MRKKIGACLILALIAFSGFSFFKEYYGCKRQNPVDIQVSISNIRCTTNSPTGTQTWHHSTPIGFMIPMLLIISLFFKKELDTFIASLYEKMTQQNMFRKAIFIGMAIFLYCFVFLATPLMVGYEYIVKPLDPKLFWVAFFISLSVAVPLACAIYVAKKSFLANEVRRALYRAPLTSLIPAIMFSLLLWPVMSIFEGGHPPLIAFYPIVAPLYVASIVLLGFLSGAFLYAISFSTKKQMWNWIATIVLLLPYLIGSFGLML